MAKHTSFDFNYAETFQPVKAVYFHPNYKNPEMNEINDIFIQDFKEYYREQLKEVENWNKRLSNGGIDSKLDSALNISYSQAKKIFSFFQISTPLNINSSKSDDIKQIKELNRAIYKKIAGGNNIKLSIYRDFFYDYVVGFQTPSQKAIRNAITELPRTIYQEAVQYFYETLQDLFNNQSNTSQNLYLDLFSYYQSYSKDNRLELMSICINNYINKTSFNVGNLSVPNSIKKYFPSGNLKNYFEYRKEDLKIDSKKQKITPTIKIKNTAFYTNLAYIMYDLLLLQLDDYEKAGKIKKSQKNKLKIFIEKRKAIFIKEFFNSMKNASLNALSQKSAVTGMYGEAITAALLKGSNIVNGVEQQGSQHIGNFSQQPPTDLIVEFDNGEVLRLQVKEWSAAWRKSRRGNLGRGSFSYIKPRNKSYYYSESPEDQTEFNLVGFLLANYSQFRKELWKDNVCSKLAKTLNHLIPNFLRAQYNEDFYQDILTNDLYILTGYYIPTFYLIKGIKNVFLNLTSNDQLFPSQLSYQNIISDCTGDSQESRRESYFNCYNNHGDIKDNNLRLNVALRDYASNSKNLVSSFKGKARVSFSGIDISDQVLAQLIF